MAKTEDSGRSNPASPAFPEGTVTIRLHRRKPQHILMDRRDVDVLLAEELEMQRVENFHLKRRVGEQAGYIRRLEDAHIGWLRRRAVEKVIKLRQATDG